MESFLEISLSLIDYDIDLVASQSESAQIDGASKRLARNPTRVELVVISQPLVDAHTSLFHLVLDALEYRLDLGERAGHCRAV